MPDLLAICGVGTCDEPVDRLTIEDHMLTHGIIRADDWKLRSWPDGTAALVDPTDR